MVGLGGWVDPWSWVGGWVELWSWVGGGVGVDGSLEVLGGWVDVWRWVGGGVGVDGCKCGMSMQDAAAGLSLPPVVTFPSNTHHHEHTHTHAHTQLNPWQLVKWRRRHTLSHTL